MKKNRKIVISKSVRKKQKNKITKISWFEKIASAYNGKKALVLGGTGFIGHHLVQYLVDAGAFVTAVTTRMSHVPNKWRVSKNLNILQGDLRNRIQMDSLVKGADFLFNFAGVSGAVESGQTPALDLEVNGYGVLNVLESCRTINPSVRIIFPGSRLEYGKPKKLPVDETHPLNPICVYGLHKLLGENYHHLYNRNFGLRTTVLRISNAYGPDSRAPGRVSYNVVNQFAKLALDNMPIQIYGDGSQVRDYIYVKDLVEAVLLVALEDSTIGKFYNLGSGEKTPFIDMVRMIISCAKGGNIVFEKWPENAKKVETGDFFFDISRIKDVIGWEPLFDFEKGVEEMVNCLRKARHNKE